MCRFAPTRAANDPSTWSAWIKRVYGSQPLLRVQLEKRNELVAEHVIAAPAGQIIPRVSFEP